jgi:hypothetical protein
VGIHDVDPAQSERLTQALAVAGVTDVNFLNN